MSDRDKAEMLRLIADVTEQADVIAGRRYAACCRAAADKLDTPSTPADTLAPSDPPCNERCIERAALIDENFALKQQLAEALTERAAMREALWLTTTGTRVALGLCDADQRAELEAWWSRGIDILARHPDITDVLRHDLPVETFAERGNTTNKETA
jgi:hypothetical protein